MKPPDFGEKQVELRCDSGEVCIYATEPGLRRLIELLQSLLERPRISHIHLEDYDILTDGSLKGAVAIFAPPK